MKKNRKLGYETEIIKTSEALKFSDGKGRTERDDFDNRNWKGEKYSEPKMGID